MKRWQLALDVIGNRLQSRPPNKCLPTVFFCAIHSISRVKERKNGSTHWIVFPRGTTESRGEEREKGVGGGDPFVRKMSRALCHTTPGRGIFGFSKTKFIHSITSTNEWADHQPDGGRGVGGGASVGNGLPHPRPPLSGTPPCPLNGTGVQIGHQRGTLCGNEVKCRNPSQPFVPLFTE